MSTEPTSPFLNNFPKIKKSHIIKSLLSHLFKKTIHFFLVLSMYVGVGLAFLFGSINYVWISVIGIIYMIGSKFNIPVLSYICRSFNYKLVKIEILKQIRLKKVDNSIYISALIYLESNSELKNIYIKQGPKQFALFMSDYINNRISQQTSFTNSLMNIKEQITQSTSTELDEQQLKEKISNNLNEIFKSHYPDSETPDENLKNTTNELASFMINMQKMEKEFEEKIANGASEEELNQLFQSLSEKIKESNKKTEDGINQK